MGILRGGRASWTITILLTMAGCSSGATKSAGAPAPTGGAATGHVPTGDAGLSDGGLPDVTFAMSGSVDGGGESFYCAYARMPVTGETAVYSAESHFTPGSHHFLVYRTSYADIPDAGASAHPCTDAEQFANITGSYYEAQTPDTRRNLPPGVAHIFKPGEILLMTAHYLNPTASFLATHVDFRLHTMDPRAVQHEAGSVFFYNYQISIPPMSEATVTRTCPIDHDINVALLWSHMHSRGIAFVATANDPTTGPSNLYATTTWSEPEARVFPTDPPVTLHAGSTITYSCTYENMTSQTIVQGESARTNEMCILHGMYWPRMESASELCLSGMSSMDPPYAADDAGTSSIDTDDAGADAGMASD